MKYILPLFLSFLLFFSTGYSQESCLLDEKAPKHLVVDRANILDDGYEKQLEAALIEFNRETSNQILVVTVNDLCGYDKAEFTYTLGENWGVGQKEFDNGIVLMIKPHGGKGQRHTFIAVGYGLEGAIPDAISKRIVEQDLLPNFKSGNFEGGINAALGNLMGLAKGEITVEQYNKKNKTPIFPLITVARGFNSFSAVD